MSDVVFTEMGNAGRKSSVVCLFFLEGEGARVGHLQILI